MAAKKKPTGTVKSLQAKPGVALKRTRSKLMVLEERTAAEKTTSKKTSLDALRLFVKTYANL